MPMSWNPILDLICIANIWIWNLDVILRVLAWGPQEFWFYRAHNPRTKSEGDFHEVSHRFELTLAVSTFLINLIFGGRRLILWSLTGQTQTELVPSCIQACNVTVAGKVDLDCSTLGMSYLSQLADISAAGHDFWFSFSLAAPCLRVFMIVKPIQYYVVVLSRSMPHVLDLFQLIMIVIILFSMIFVNLFCGLFSLVLREEDVAAPHGNFDTLPKAMMTLLQLMVGEGWHDVMYAGIEVGGWTAGLMFIIYAFLLTVLMANLLIGYVFLSFLLCLVNGCVCVSVLLVCRDDSAVVPFLLPMIERSHVTISPTYHDPTGWS